MIPTEEVEHRHRSTATPRRVYIPKWSLILAAVILVPLALYLGLMIGFYYVDNIFPNATMRCQP